MIIGILQNEDPQSSEKWRVACEKSGISYRVIDLTENNWFSNISEGYFDLFLVKPPGSLERFKTLYDERIYIINKIMKKPIYPSFEEVYIYENKKMLHYFLDGSGIPHPKTWIFYHKEEAMHFIQNCKFPIIGKTSIGASGSGVVILKNYQETMKYLKRAFSGRGIKRRFGPNRVIGSPSKWLKKTFKEPSYFFNKIREYISIYKDSQKSFTIFQEYIQHEFEWRAVRIGESYFAHQKIKYKDKASGSKGINFKNPPIKLLEFVREITDKNQFKFMAIDCFEDRSGGYLVNEMQTIFGHVQDHILEVNGIPGRYLYKNGKWEFEAGDFNSNESYDLRLKVAINLFEKKHL